MGKIISIFDLLPKEEEKKEEKEIEFDSMIESNGKWVRSILKRSGFDTVIHISEDDVYTYYLCIDDTDPTRMAHNLMFRVKKNKECDE